jgi:bifunctional DNA-binding transcriptional regulator/antitoxin component of YhaV-PrlF toxin-antitoxin module
MIITIDRAGRLVVPKALRDSIGLTAGPVEIAVVGAALVIEAQHAGLEERDGHLVLPATGSPTTVEAIRELRRADQR